MDQNPVEKQNAYCFAISERLYENVVSHVRTNREKRNPEYHRQPGTHKTSIKADIRHLRRELLLLEKLLDSNPYWEDEGRLAMFRRASHD